MRSPAAPGAASGAASGATLGAASGAAPGTAADARSVSSIHNVRPARLSCCSSRGTSPCSARACAHAARTRSLSCAPVRADSSVAQSSAGSTPSAMPSRRAHAGDAYSHSPPSPCSDIPTGLRSTRNRASTPASASLPTGGLAVFTLGVSDMVSTSRSEPAGPRASYQPRPFWCNVTVPTNVPFSRRTHSTTDVHCGCATDSVCARIAPTGAGTQSDRPAAVWHPNPACSSKGERDV